MAREFAFAAPRAEEMTRGVVVAGMGMATGLAQGIVAKIAPQLGVVAPILTWGSLLVTPVIGIAGALFTRGMISDAFLGVATGSTGVLGYSIPALMPEMALGRLSAGPGGPKLLPPGNPANLARYQPANARVGIEF